MTFFARLFGRGTAPKQSQVPSPLELAVMQAMHTVVGIQLRLAHTNIVDASKDRWVAGYIWGAHTSIIEHHGLEPSDQSTSELIELSYAALYPSPEAGLLAYRAILNDAVQGDEVFLAGLDLAGADIDRWLATGQPVVGLSEGFIDREKRREIAREEAKMLQEGMRIGISYEDWFEGQKASAFDLGEQWAREWATPSELQRVSRLKGCTFVELNDRRILSQSIRDGIRNFDLETLHKAIHDRVHDFDFGAPGDVPVQVLIDGHRTEPEQLQAFVNGACGVIDALSTAGKS